jgi:hypothetical protein
VIDQINFNRRKREKERKKRKKRRGEMGGGEVCYLLFGEGLALHELLDLVVEIALRIGTHRGECLESKRSAGKGRKR